MDLDLSPYFSSSLRLYRSPSQIARIVTEKWASDNLYCPRCGQPLHKYGDNTRVYDFYCDHPDPTFMLVTEYSKDNFQLKSTKSFPHHSFPGTIVGAEYYTTRASLKNGSFPSLILLHYERKRQEMRDGLFIHRLSVTLNSIRKRAPLTEGARRHGWVGSDIILSEIPQAGRIPIITESTVVPIKTVMDKWLKVENVLRGNLERRSWTSDVMLVVDKLPDRFSSEDVYFYTQTLEGLHPGNKHVRDKIRQQLQILRDNGYLKFVSRGIYEKVKR